MPIDTGSCTIEINRCRPFCRMRNNLGKDGVAFLDGHIIVTLAANNIVNLDNTISISIAAHTVHGHRRGDVLFPTGIESMVFCGGARSAGENLRVGRRCVVLMIPAAEGPSVTFRFLNGGGVQVVAVRLVERGGEDRILRIEMPAVAVKGDGVFVGNPLGIDMRIICCLPCACKIQRITRARLVHIPTAKSITLTSDIVYITSSTFREVIIHGLVKLDLEGGGRGHAGGARIG